MKAFFFLPSLEGGGAEKTMLRIAKYMCNNQENDIFLMLLNQSNSEKHINAYNEIIDSRISVIDLQCPLESTSKFMMIYKIRACIKENNPNVIISTMLKANVLIGFALLGTKYSKKLILRESCKRSVFSYSFIEKNMVRFVYNHLCACVLALTNGVGEDIVNTFSIKKEKIRVIYNPVDIALVNAKSTEKIIHMPKHKVQFVSIGRLHKVKDYPTIIEAFSILKTEMKEVDFGEWILGEGAERDYLLDKIDKKGLNDRITLLGFDTNPYKYLKAADALILSSLNEGFANVIIEAMALGVPVISSECDFGPKEIITDRTNGLLFSVGDARELANVIKQFISDQDLQEKLRNEGRLHANEYDISKIGKQYRNLFDEIGQ